MDYISPCIRCGKSRIIARVWKEKIVTAAGASMLVHTQTICPDPACQKIVEDKFAVEKQKSDEIKRNFLKRAEDRRNRGLKKSAKIAARKSIRL